MVANAAALPTVGVIDDEESIREGCRQLLESEGYRVAVKRNGRRGLRLVGRKRPDAVLVDLKMPGMGGLEVLARIRKIDPTIITVVITGYGTVESAVEAMRLGAADFLCKPFDERELLASIRRSFDRTRSGQSQEASCAQTPNRATVIEVLERAHRDKEFFARLWEHGSRALEGYELTHEEKAAIVSGDQRWIEKHVGKPTENQRAWLECRLQMERW